MEITEHTIRLFYGSGACTLYKDRKDIIGIDGILYIDRRLSIENAKQVVKERNKRYLKNFPHKIADAFYYKGQIIKL